MNGLDTMKEREVNIFPAFWQSCQVDMGQPWLQAENIYWHKIILFSRNLPCELWNILPFVKAVFKDRSGWNNLYETCMKHDLGLKSCFI